MFGLGEGKKMEGPTQGIEGEGHVTACPPQARDDALLQQARNKHNTSQRESERKRAKE